MYGTVGSSTYEATHVNVNSSTIKGIVDEWYRNNMDKVSKKPFIEYIDNNLCETGR